MTADCGHDLLILGCSQRKSALTGPATTVYDGPLFRTLRKRSVEFTEPFDVLILSARYGIVKGTDVIEPYDERLGKTTSREFANLISSQLDSVLPAQLNRVLILAPQSYLALLPLATIRSRAARIESLSGRPGKCQTMLLQWLGVSYERKRARPNHLGPLAAHKPITDPLLLRTAVAVVIEQAKQSRIPIKWYARVDENLVPAKKFVSHITGVAVSQFETCHALALLRAYGIETCQVPEA